MPYVDDAPDTLTEAYWYDVPDQTLPTPATPAVCKGRLARYFESFAASMGLYRHTARVAGRHQTILTPTDILAQNYPHLYLQVMCG
jgi:hypothetical protein